MDAGAASSALWTEPLVHRLKHRFPFVVSIQREFSNGRQMLEYIAHAIFAENQRRDTMEGQWLQLEMRRKDNNLRSRRAYRLKDMKDSDIPSIKWDTVATILNLLEKVVAPLMQFSDDITIQADMLQLELQSIAEESIQVFSSSYANTCECLERLLEDSKDRLRSLRKTVGLSTTSERKLLQLHRWLLQKHHDVVEEALKLETDDSNRESLRKKLGSIAAELSSTSTSAISESTCSPYVLLVLDQYESMSDTIVADFLHMWRDHASPTLGLGLILGLSSTLSPSFRRMPRSISTKIDMEPFFLEDSSKSFNDIVQTLLIAGEFPLMISGTVYRWLHNTFTRAHSIQAFLAALKLILYEHVASKPIHAVAFFPLPELVDSDLPHTAQAYCKKLQQGSLMEDINKVYAWKHVWQCMWNCVEMVWQMCMRFEPSLSTKNVDVVALALDGKLVKSPLAGRMHAFLCQASIRALHKLVVEWRQCVARYDMEAPPEVNLSSVTNAISEMAHILSFVHESSDEDEMIAKMIPEVRQDVWKVLAEHIMPCLSPALPLACPKAGRLFHFNGVQTLKTPIESKHEATLRQFLECPPKHSKGAWSHDMHILHEFYRHTAGMLINVAEWLDDFQSKTTDKAHIHPRFLRCLAAMQYLGLIRRYGRSEDYVEKLVFV
ncbi:hypothetical protein Ae201684_016926 [Aphanomyces euteiches]|uniref:Origin recognition complex subunit 3 N-terminal domain-containing protein n=1 Tax=Aphanomyces euteiches TaxID=100861 RepID=A0A6G0WAU9_9STRA|nr:hypothetical protein Ae201684_016926 [Aphanomyces euteiches]